MIKLDWLLCKVGVKTITWVIDYWFNICKQQYAPFKAQSTVLQILVIVQSANRRKEWTSCWEDFQKQQKKTGLKKCRMIGELAQAYGLVENKGINWIFIHNAKKVI